eukprot:CAMPEP_0194135550 /NCGR_PEP_ID=MMETSP0152-20130528/5651_1 /TAXON_ID=1049557 /ORGANISM="Thalassiothrix antarctica, Strain L6-D1" /LENGTH=543 /DNA_ID=CAMNT_0038831849 /DNA_START=59 /DNA_END=1690 /DNA_ORIENTATION=+
MASLSHLNSLIQQEELKFVFVGGKGGVGKTTSSSAIATLFAKYGKKRTLLVSTDPAHSLGDAFRMEFSNIPTSPNNIPNLHVMEIDPSESMKEHLSDWTKLANGLTGDSSNDDGENTMKEKINSFQSWLSGIPGIDEATALSQAITHIESGNYDIIVFDTAPTGHTLKLLALPDIIQAGITKIQSWSSTLYGYWDAMKGLATSGSTAESSKRTSAKEEISRKLSTYKRDIQKVALMLKDQLRTRFVVVCIAEYLSISETKRLLCELRTNQVKASHVIVNQLVIQDALTSAQLEELEALAEVGNLELNQDLLKRTIHACRLTTSRKVIQTKYLNTLKESDEVKDLDGLCEVPLLSEEVTGIAALEKFASLLITTDLVERTVDAGNTTPQKLYDDELANTEQEQEWTPSQGDTVKVQNLAKSAQYNELDGTIIADCNEETGRYGVEIKYKGKRKILALQPKNIRPIADNHPKKAKSSTNNTSTPSTLENKISKLLEDPEVKQLVQKNPKYEAAIKDCMGNPMNALQYMSDPDMSPLISKMMSKMM